MQVTFFKNLPIKTLFASHRKYKSEMIKIFKFALSVVWWSPDKESFYLDQKYQGYLSKKHDQMVCQNSPEVDGYQQLH